MKMKSFWGCFLVAVSLLLGTGQVVVASEITDDVKGTIDKVLEIVSDENLKKDPVLRRKKLREVIGLRFNFKQMVHLTDHAPYVRAVLQHTRTVCLA